MSEGIGSFSGYRVERTLGRGGMGVVYEAVQTSLDRRVALKVLRPELAEDPAFVERFRREGKLQASLEHPHVLDVYEVGESPDGLFISMRLVEGATLADLLREGKLDGQQALRILGEVGEALDAAHAAGLVHRDVKPQNVLVSDDGSAYLADFGLTRGGSEPMTAASRPMLGTVAYVAPEVIRGEEPGPASDRYAFAATLFHCLSGDFVFPLGSDAAVLFAHTSQPPPRISERRPELPEALDPLFARALAKDPAERSASARELVEDVRKRLGENAIAGLRPASPNRDYVPTPVTVPSQPASARSEPVRSSRPVALLAGVAMVAALASGVGVALLTSDGGDAEIPPEVPVPEVREGAEPLGSSLGAPDDSVGCLGPGAKRSSSCAILQTELPGAQLLVPEDGLIVGWSVRGAEGEFALDVIRPGGDDTIRVGRSQFESAGNKAPHSFATSLPVERGDLLGITLSEDAVIGITETPGATTDRWLDPLGGFYGSPDREEGTGFDFELALRVDFVAGASLEPPEQLTGSEAAEAPDGVVRKRAAVEISNPPAIANVELVELDDSVVLDLVRGDRRVARVVVPDLVPESQLLDLRYFTFEGEPSAEVAVFWVNPNSGRVIFHHFRVTTSEFEFLG